jgi:hypothetical protein
VDIIADVAADPAVESSVAKLLGGLFNHLKEHLATGNIAAVEQAVNDGLHAVPDMVAAVTANTQPPAGDQGA